MVHTSWEGLVTVNGYMKIMKTFRVDSRLMIEIVWFRCVPRHGMNYLTLQTTSTDVHMEILRKGASLLVWLVLKCRISNFEDEISLRMGDCEALYFLKNKIDNLNLLMRGKCVIVWYIYIYIKKKWNEKSLDFSILFPSPSYMAKLPLPHIFYFFRPTSSGDHLNLLSLVPRPLFLPLLVSFSPSLALSLSL